MSVYMAKLRHVAVPSCAKGKLPCLDGIEVAFWTISDTRSFLYFSMASAIFVWELFVSFGLVFCFFISVSLLLCFSSSLPFAFLLFPASLLLYIVLYSASPVFCFFASLLLRSCCFFASLLLHCAASLLLRFSLLFCFSSFCASLLPAFPCFFACLLFCFYALPSFFFPFSYCR